ncbi:MAG: hypothetical protein HYR94_25520 [Chloroflexi bacterium]|nr:hypothetical protein [Chloroflexota bacterium]
MMIIDFEITPGNLPEDGDEDESLVTKIFYHPDTVSQGEYFAIYEFLLDPEIRDDPEMIAAVLKEFAGWAQHMLEQMRKLGLIDQTESYDQ